MRSWSVRTADHLSEETLPKTDTYFSRLSQAGGQKGRSRSWAAGNIAFKPKFNVPHWRDYF